jgi:hypothetical protein
MEAAYVRRFDGRSNPSGVRRSYLEDTPVAGEGNRAMVGLGELHDRPAALVGNLTWAGRS